MPGKNLTRDEARERASVLSVTSSDVMLDLTTGPATFRSRTTVVFEADPPGGDTFIDLIATSVEEITLNGEPLDPATHFDGVRVTLPGLRSGNVLTVDATASYMNTGEGLHRFVDPVDDEVYLYSQFQVADARRMFAVFDQPDLKAPFAFTVTAPAHWHVVSNETTPEPEAVEAADGNDSGNHSGTAVWTFPATPPISSYITALIAGPYECRRDEVTTRKGVVPLAIFCRRSLAGYLDFDNVFDCTKRGFAFLEKEFDCDYPFAKYDQLFTPEYNMGAMENAGAVTLNEKYVFRARVTESVVERRALTILHELAHMWFGNLVTMRWWDDLWLNESFAEWASTTAQAEATQWVDAWTTFGTSEKAWAYRQDQLSSTHPVVADIRDLEDVEVNFDGITYAKGGSVLKQLVAYVGREAFTAGLRAYFAKHAWQNTTLRDLLAELEVTSGRDLSTWSELWLETAGVNTLRPDVAVDGQGVITAAAIVQSAAKGHPTIRPHRLAVGLYDLVGDRLVRVARHEVDVDGERTDVAELVGARQPDLLLVNEDDLAYAKVRLDARSLATALAYPRGFDEGLPRSLVLGVAWDMTRDAEMPGCDFISFVLRSLPGERDSTLLRVLLDQLKATTELYVAPQHREATLAAIAPQVRALAEAAVPASDAQLQLVSAFAASARGADDLARVRDLLSGATLLPGLAVDTEMRWTLLTSLAAGGAVGEAVIEAEGALDNTATGRERAARALAALPHAAAKAAAWRKAVEEDGLPNQTIDAVGEGFGTVHDPALLLPYVERYHAALLEVWASRTHAIAESIVARFYPAALADQGLLDSTQAWLHANTGAAAGLRRLVAENRDGIARALAAQECDARRD